MNMLALDEITDRHCWIFRYAALHHRNGMDSGKLFHESCNRSLALSVMHVHIFRSLDSRVSCRRSSVSVLVDGVPEIPAHYAVFKKSQIHVETIRCYLRIVLELWAISIFSRRVPIDSFSFRVSKCRLRSLPEWNWESIAVQSLRGPSFPWSEGK